MSRLGGMPEHPGRRGLTGLATHWGGFLVSGGIAFASDATVLLVLTKLLGLAPLMARLIAIACAMVAGWRAHRYLTFGLPTRPSLQEFLGYAAVAWTSAAVNYAVFAAILLWWPQTEPLIALVGASLVAMTFSYLGMRFGAFRKSLAALRNRTD